MGFSNPDPRLHEPVLLGEVLRLLDPRPGEVVVDATLGSGGHAREILKRIGSKGRLIGIDQDPEALQRAQKNLQDFPQVDYAQENFSRLDKVVLSLNLKAVDAVLLDVGLSTDQLEDARRGFSFLKEGPLDMRRDPEGCLTAQDLVNDLSQGELEKLFRVYGEERWARRIAAAIFRERVKSPIETTGALSELIKRTVPARYRFGSLHPATRVFQALRIAVNRELEALGEVLPKAFEVLSPGGRLAVISFHSLEDRIVKRTFRQWASESKVEVLTRKPIEPGAEEIGRNPRSRSAKLRAIEKSKEIDR